MIPKPKALKAKDTNSSSTAALLAAAHSTAKAVEYMVRMAHEESQAKSSCPVSSGGGDGDELVPSRDVGKAKAMAKVGATLPLQEHASNAAAIAAKFAGRPHPKAAKLAASSPGPLSATFAGRYPPRHPQRLVAWNNMVQVFNKLKEENKKESKRSMTQTEWYSLHAEGFGLHRRKKIAVMKKPAGQGAAAGQEAAAGGEEVTPPGLSEKEPSPQSRSVEEAEEEEKEEEEEVPSEALRRASHSELEVVPEEEEEEDEEEEEAEEMEGEEVTPNPHCQPGVRVRGGLIERSFEAHEA
jgi:hypothetical protein